MATRVVLENFQSLKMNKFQEMREKLSQNFSELSTLVNQRKLELDRKINDLEIEYNSKYKQFEKDKQTLTKLSEHNVHELSQNSLLQFQEYLNKEINAKIQELTDEFEKHSELKLILNWNYDVLMNEIDGIDVELTRRVNREDEESTCGVVLPVRSAPRRHRHVFSPPRTPTTSVQRNPIGHCSVEYNSSSD